MYISSTASFFQFKDNWKIGDHGLGDDNVLGNHMSVSYDNPQIEHNIPQICTANGGNHFGPWPQSKLKQFVNLQANVIAANTVGLPHFTTSLYPIRTYCLVVQHTNVVC